MITFDPRNFPDQQRTLSVWRTPAPSGGTATQAAYTGTRLTGALCPPMTLSSQIPEDGRTAWVFFYSGAYEVRAGDELRGGTAEIYRVYKAERWTQVGTPVRAAFAERVT